MGLHVLGEPYTLSPKNHFWGSARFGSKESLLGICSVWVQRITSGICSVWVQRITLGDFLSLDQKISLARVGSKESLLGTFSLWAKQNTLGDFLPWVQRITLEDLLTLGPKNHFWGNLLTLSPKNHFWGPSLSGPNKILWGTSCPGSKE